MELTDDTGERFLYDYLKLLKVLDQRLQQPLPEGGWAAVLGQLKEPVQLTSTAAASSSAAACSAASPSSAALASASVPTGQQLGGTEELRD